MFESKAKTYSRIEATKESLRKEKAEYWRQEKQRRKFHFVTDTHSVFYTTAMDALEAKLLANTDFISSEIRNNAYGEVFFVALKDLTLYAVFKTENSDFSYSPLFDAPIKLTDNSKIMVSSFSLLLLFVILSLHTLTQIFQVDPEIVGSSLLFPEFSVSCHKCQVIQASTIGSFFTTDDIIMPTFSYSVDDSPGDWDNGGGWGQADDLVLSSEKLSKRQKKTRRIQRRKDFETSSKGPFLFFHFKHV